MRGFSGCFPDEARKNGCPMPGVHEAWIEKAERPAGGIIPSSTLAGGAEERRALSLTQGSDGCATDPTKIALPAIDEIGLLKVTGKAFRTDIVAQAAATGFDGGSERFPDCENQLFAAQQRNAAGGQARMDACTKQRLTCVDVADADYDMTVHDYVLDCSAAATDMGMHPGRG